LLIKFAKFWPHLCSGHKQHSRFFLWGLLDTNNSR
jgi:hypothetical protein